MTSFCSPEDANVLGRKDCHIASGRPAIKMHIGERLPGDIHGEPLVQVKLILSHVRRA